MTFYPLAPKGIMSLVHSSLSRYVQLFRATAGFILLAAFFKDLPFYWGHLSSHHALYWFVMILTLLLQTYLWAAVFYAADRVLKGQALSFSAIASAVFDKFYHIVSAFCCYLLGFAFVFFMGFLLARGIGPHIALERLQGFVILLLVGVPVTLYLLTFLFAAPLSVVESVALWQAFYESASLTWNKQLWRVFMVYIALFLLGLLVFPGTPHQHLLAVQHLDFLFNIAILLLFAPLAVALVLLLLNDLRLRWRLARSEA